MQSATAWIKTDTREKQQYSGAQKLDTGLVVQHTDVLVLFSEFNACQ